MNAIAQPDIAEPPGDAVTSQRLLWSAEELADVLGFGVRTIRRMEVEGRIPRPIAFGRYLRWDAEEIRRWISARCPHRDEWEKTTNGDSL